jgi:hypothetical protein
MHIHDITFKSVRTVFVASAIIQPLASVLSALACRLPLRAKRPDVPFPPHSKVPGVIRCQTSPRTRRSANHNDSRFGYPPITKPDDRVPQNQNATRTQILLPCPFPLPRPWPCPSPLVREMQAYYFNADSDILSLCPLPLQRNVGSTVA